MSRYRTLLAVFATLSLIGGAGAAAAQARAAAGPSQPAATWPFGYLTTLAVAVKCPPDAGALRGGTYGLGGGFWPGLAEAMQRLFLPLLQR